MQTFLFHGGRFLDPRRDELIEGIEVLVEGDTVREVSDNLIAIASGASPHRSRAAAR